MESATITAENQFTDGLDVTNRPFTVSISGTFVATVTVQRKRIDEEDTEYRDFAEYTEAFEDNGYSVGKWIYRIGVKTGDFTSGSIDAMIVKGV